MIRAVLLQRCPNCRQGNIYAGFLAMHPACPQCGWEYEREPGYFTGAMYASYILGIALTLPVWLGMLLAEAPYGWIMAAVGLELVIIFPLLFRYSRVLWMHFDVFFNGTGETSSRSRP